MAELDEIIEKIDRHRSDIKKFGVRRLGIFGSFTRGEQKPDSDIDFLVEFEKETFDSFMGLCFFLEDLLGRNVDLAISHALKPRIKPVILKEVVYVEGEFENSEIA